MTGRDPPFFRKLVLVAALYVASPSALAQQQPAQPFGPPPSDRATNDDSPGASEPPLAASFRPLRLRIDGGVGVLSPKDVNAYIKSKLPGDAYARTNYSNNLLLLSSSASLAYYPARFVGVRPSLAYLLGLREQTLQPGTRDTFSMHSLALGVSLDVAYDTGGLARYFVSPGIAYHLAWFEGFSARGVGLSLALGTELTFGQAHLRGVSIALVVRSAKLPTTDGPLSKVPMRDLDFTSVLVCVGFQTGI